MPQAGADNQTSGSPHRARRLHTPLGVIVYLAAALPLILAGFDRGRAEFDQRFFHEPTIRQFAGQWPRPDLSNYLSATTPGYHLVLALVARFVSPSLLALKLAGAAFTATLLWVLEEAVRRRLGDRSGLRSLALMAPMVCSLYVLGPGVWLQPDNAGWLGVLLILLIALRRTWDEASLIGGALALLVLVWIRQTHVWTAGLLWLAAWLGSVRTGAGPDDEPGLLSVTRPRLARAALAVLSTLPALACLAWFVVLWGGLTPPGNGDQFRKQHNAGANPATPAFVCSLLAVYSVFFGAWLWPAFKDLIRRRPGLVAAAAVGGLVLGVVPKTNYEYEPRATGLWNLVRVTDHLGLVIGGRTSVLIAALAAAGAVALACWLVQLPRRERWIFGLGLAGFTLAQSANSNAWHRYFEPMLLMTLALMAATLARSVPTGRSGRLFWLGPAVLAALLAAVTALELWRAEPVVKTW